MGTNVWPGQTAALNFRATGYTRKREARWAVGWFRQRAGEKITKVTATGMTKLDEAVDGTRARATEGKGSVGCGLDDK